MNIIISMFNDNERIEIESFLNRIEKIDEIKAYDDIYLAINMMKENKPCVGVFDIEKFDNTMRTLACISEMKDINSKAKVILVANSDDEVITSAAFRFGINYVIVRPYNIDSLIDRIIDLCASGLVINDDLKRKNKNMHIERMISTILNGTGILPNLKGYKYLKEAIALGFQNREFLAAVTKLLYPEIARNNNTSTDRVERAIRHAIASAWNKCEGNGFYKKMGFGDAFKDKRPTNSEYIFAVVEYLNNHFI